MLIMQGVPGTAQVLGALRTPQPPWHVDETGLQIRACGVGGEEPSIGEWAKP